MKAGSKPKLQVVPRIPPIKRRLAELGMTQKELARLMKVTPRTINLYCRDDYILLPDDIRTHALCRILKIDLNYFYS
jgi:DNA-binding CsgD family transcriptional regulator